MVLGLVALSGLRPWDGDEVKPHLLPPALEMGVGESAPLPSPSPVVAVADAAVAPGRAKVVRDRRGAVPREAEAPTGGALAVAPARPVADADGGAAPSPIPSPAPVVPAPEPQPAPSPELASVPAPSPDAAPEAGAPSGGGRPVTAGSPGFEEREEQCEGDEYLLTITFVDEESAGEEPAAEEPAGEELATGDAPAVRIVLQRTGADGDVDELELEGDLDDARSLVLQLSSEGACVEVLLAPSGAGDEPEPAPPIAP